MSKVTQLAPTFDIKDPQVRAFCDSLANAWSLRNGSIGADDSQRFITKEEWDQIAQNPAIRAIAGIGQPGGGEGTGQPTGGGPNTPQLVTNLIDWLNSGITLIDFASVRKTGNELWAAIYALSNEVHSTAGGILTDAEALKNGITQINTVSSTSTSANAQALFALKASVEDEETGLEAATAAILSINNVSAFSSSANARQLSGLIAAVNDPTTGLTATQAAIVQLNNVSATSTSANASALYGLTAQVNNPTTGLPKAFVDIAAINDMSVSSSSANARMVAGLYGQVNDGTSGLNAAYAAINAINTIDVNNQQSASARTLAGLQVGVGLKARVFAQATPPASSSSYQLKENDLWIETDNANFLWRWNGSGWVDGSDTRIAQVMAGVTNEQNARVSSDAALVQAINTVWANVGNVTQTLVQSGATVTINPNAGTVAQQWTQVQTAVIDPSTGTNKIAAVQQQLNAVADPTTGWLSSFYGIKVQAGGAIAGMSIAANSRPGSAPESAIVFLADNFVIAQAGYIRGVSQEFRPLFVQNNTVYLAATRFKDYVSSSNYVQNAQGWKISDTGDAEFNGSVKFNGSLLSGTTYTDRNSGQQLPSVAVGTYQADLVSGTTPHTSASLTFWGPNHHAFTGLYNRVRAGTVAITFTVTGVVDHYLSLWHRYPTTGWMPLVGTIEPNSDYGAAAISWSGPVGFGFGDYIQFGFAPTNTSGSPANGAKVDVKAFSATITAVNL
jgi:hypothetical protein